MPRFVLLWHECPHDYREGPHWDLMIERDGVDQEHRLATWSLQQLPVEWKGFVKRLSPDGAFSNQVPLRVTRLPDHRAAYLDYEGPLSGGRGVVERVLTGEAEWLEASSGRLRVRLPGPAGPVGVVELTATTTGGWGLGWLPEALTP